METFIKFIGKLPLVGKLAIRPFAFSLYQSTTKWERTKNYLFLMVVLAILTLSHSIQIGAGVSLLHFDAPFWAEAIAVAYILVNISVILAEIHLALRATRFARYAPYRRVKRYDNYHSFKEILVMGVVTLTGQAIFGFVYLYYE